MREHLNFSYLIYWSWDMDYPLRLHAQTGYAA